MNIWDYALLYHQSSFNGAVHKQTLFYCASYIWPFFLFFFFFANWRFVAALCQAILLVPFFFSTALAHFCLCENFGNSHNISKLWYLLLWSMINDLWGYCCNCFGFHEFQLYEMVGLTDKFMLALTTVSTDNFPTSFSPQSFLFSGTQWYLN